VALQRRLARLHRTHRRRVGTKLRRQRSASSSQEIHDPLIPTLTRTSLCIDIAADNLAGRNGGLVGLWPVSRDRSRNFGDRGAARPSPFRTLRREHINAERPVRAPLVNNVSAIILAMSGHWKFRHQIMRFETCVLKTSASGNRTESGADHLDERLHESPTVRAADIGDRIIHTA